jgi:hypothetical protein
VCDSMAGQQQIGRSYERKLVGCTVGLLRHWVAAGDSAQMIAWSPPMLACCCHSSVAAHFVEDRWLRQHGVDMASSVRQVPHP